MSFCWQDYFISPTTPSSSSDTYATFWAIVELCNLQIASSISLNYLWTISLHSCGYYPCRDCHLFWGICDIQHYITWSPFCFSFPEPPLALRDGIFPWTRVCYHPLQQHPVLPLSTWNYLISIFPLGQEALWRQEFFTPIWSEAKVAQSCPTLCDPKEFSRPEYWSG